jgi:hypothetical protein
MLLEKRRPSETTRETACDPERIARFARHMLHAELTMPEGDNPLLAADAVREASAERITSREYFFALTRVLRIAREVMRQDQIEAALHCVTEPRPAPAPRRQPRRASQNQSPRNE